MAQTFDIRFDRSAGLAALFEAPANEFRWKGAGHLSIDAQGISIAARRGLMRFFGHAQSLRIAANSLIEVYREGNALRVEFSTPESSRVVLPFWVADRKAAAEIVTLLPTQRSVELEDDAGSSRTYRFDRRFAVLLAVGFVTLGVGIAALQRYLADDRFASGVEPVVQPAEQVSTQDSTLAASPTAPLASDASRQVANGPPASLSVPVDIEAPELSAPSMDLSPRAAPTPVVAAASTRRDNTRPRVRFARPSPDGIVPIVPGDPRYAVAREQFDLFRAASDVLRADYLSVRESPTAQNLESLEARWRIVASRIHNTAEFAGIEFLALREIELAIVSSWRAFLSIYAAGLRAGDKSLIELSLAHLAFTERLEALFPQFVH